MPSDSRIHLYALPWMALVLVAVGFLILLFSGDFVIGGVLLVLGVFGGVALLLWQALTESPPEQEPLVRDGDFGPCCMCGAPVDESAYARLGLTIERSDGSIVSVLGDAEVGRCCGPDCTRRLWDRLAMILPAGTAEGVEHVIETLARSKT